MSVTENKETVRRWFAETVRGGIDVPVLLRTLDETFAAGFVDHDGPDPEHGREVLRQVLPGMLHAFPDLHFTIEQLIGEGDLVAVRLRGEATHTRDVMGKAPTGKHITWTENEIFRFEDRLIVESWGEGTLDEALAEVGLGFRAGRQ